MTTRYFYINILFITILTSFSCAGYAQFTDNYLNKKNVGNVKITANPALNSLTQKKLIHDSFHAGYYGFRVQVYFTAGNFSKQGAYDAAQTVYGIYPEIPAYISFKEPYYRVRVGNFRTKLDADKFRNKLNKYFKGCFVVNDFISIYDEKYAPVIIESDSTNLNTDRFDEND